MQPDPLDDRGLGGSEPDLPSRDVHRGHEPPSSVGTVTHSPALPHRDELDGLDRAEIDAGRVVDETSGVER